MILLSLSFAKPFNRQKYLPSQKPLSQQNTVVKLTTALYFLFLFFDLPPKPDFLLAAKTSQSAKRGGQTRRI